MQHFEITSIYIVEPCFGELLAANLSKSISICLLSILLVSEWSIVMVPNSSAWKDTFTVLGTLITRYGQSFVFSVRSQYSLFQNASSLIVNTS